MYNCKNNIITKRKVLLIIFFLCLFLFLSYICYIYLCKIKTYSIENAKVQAYMQDIYCQNDIDYYVNLQIQEESGAIEQIRYDQPEGISISWTSKKWAESYEISFSPDKNGHTTVLNINEGSVNKVTIYNLIPNQKYLYKVYGITASGRKRVIDFGYINVIGTVRMVKADSLNNIRDLGGWETTDGKRIRYGVIYRGCAMNGDWGVLLTEADKRLLVDDLGVTMELDFRSEEESLSISESPLGVKYERISISAYADYVNDPGKTLSDIINILIENDVVYMHCTAGCDRTGTISWLLLGLLGVSEEQLIIEYELSSFSRWGIRSWEERNGGMDNIIQTYPGDSLREQIENFFLANGVSQEQIIAFRNKMLTN